MLDAPSICKRISGFWPVDAGSAKLNFDTDRRNQGADARIRMAVERTGVPIQQDDRFAAAIRARAMAGGSRRPAGQLRQDQCPEG